MKLLQKGHGGFRQKEGLCRYATTIDDGLQKFRNITMESKLRFVAENGLNVPPLLHLHSKQVDRWHSHHFDGDRRQFAMATDLFSCRQLESVDDV